jgi:hypothetical protein
MHHDGRSYGRRGGTGCIPKDVMQLTGIAITLVGLGSDAILQVRTQTAYDIVKVFANAVHIGKSFISKHKDETNLPSATDSARFALTYP